VKERGLDTGDWKAGRGGGSRAPSYGSIPRIPSGPGPQWGLCSGQWARWQSTPQYHGGGPPIHRPTITKLQNQK